MVKRVDRSLVVGLDIGTSKVACIVGELGDDGDMEVVGIGVSPSRGLRKGVVVNLESTVQCIQKAVMEAELMAGCRIRSVYAGIAGSHIKSMNSPGIVAIKDKEVTQGDIERVIDSARAVAIPADQRILHIFPQEFVIDGQEGIKDPIGMSGIRLEAKVHIVTCAVSAYQNIFKCIRRCGLEVEELVLEQVASSMAVLTDDERDLGVCLVDIGGGTTDMAIYTGGSIRATDVIPIAGDQVTNDIAMALRTPKDSAEDIKKAYACALTQLAPIEDTIEIASTGNRPVRLISRQNLAEIVGPRYEELLLLIEDELARTRFSELIPAGVVLTGGSSKVRGLVELAEEVFHMPVRIGTPQSITGLGEVVNNPIYSTSAGLLLFGRQHINQGIGNGYQGMGLKNTWTRIKNWFTGNF
jgi:cell division protein FtsA